MIKRPNPFDEIRRKHKKCVEENFAKAAFNSTTYRIFHKGAGEKLRAFVKDAIGDGQRLVRGDQRDFNRKHLDIVESFPPSIRLARGRKPKFGHKAKVVDIYLKALYSYRQPLSPAGARKLGERLHVPLDNLVLSSIRKEFATELTGLRPANLRLAHLTPKNYSQIQKLLREHAEAAGTIPILYDDRYEQKRGAS